MLRSFRVRLIIAFVALFAAVSVAVSFVGMLLREQQIKTLFDSELTLRADAIREAILRQPSVDSAAVAKAVGELSQSVYFRDFFVQVYNKREEVVAKSANLGKSELKLARPFDDKSFDNIVIQRKREQNHFPDGGPSDLRGLRTRFAGTDGIEYLAIIATDPAYVLDSIQMTRWLFIAGNLAGLLAAAAAAYFVTGAMARRIGDLAEQIEQVTPDNLTHRLQLRDRDEIATLADHVNAMLDRLKAGFDTQERFIHDASHELKTPIATVQAEAQALMLGEASREELIDFVRSTNDEMRRLGRLTEALLLLTRTSDTAWTRRFMPLEISETALAAVRHLSALAADHHVRLTLHSSPDHDELLMIRCDADLLEAMVSNLVRNAIRFSPRNGEVRVTLDGSERDVLVIVEDEGPGIPSDILPHLFDRYFETSQVRVRRGAGLGLAIASTVARLHGGSIAVDNRQEGGARFTVRLPRSVSGDVPKNVNNPA